MKKLYHKRPAGCKFLYVLLKIIFETVPWGVPRAAKAGIPEKEVEKRGLSDIMLIKEDKFLYGGVDL